MRRMVLVTTVLVLGVLLACQSGATVGGRQNCSSKSVLGAGSGTCEGGWKKLSGVTTLEIENEDIWSSDQVPVEMQISVESGTVQVSCKQPGGERMKVQARPEQPAVLAGICEADADEFDITFESLDGDATGINYVLEYQIP